MTAQLTPSNVTAPRIMSGRSSRLVPRWVDEALMITVATLPSVTVAFFLARGGVERFTDTGDILSSLAAISGLVGSTLLAVILLAAARIPGLDALVGHDRLLLVHAALGPWVVISLVVHAALAVAAYCVDTRMGVIDMILLLWGMPDFMWAFVGLALMLVVALSSIRAIRRWLGYEPWQMIHLLSYAAVLASLPHQFSRGGTFSTGVAHWYWIGLFGASLFAFLNFRILLPLVVSLEQLAVVTRTEQETHDTVSIWIRLRHPDRLGIEPGQFLNWRFLSRTLWWHPHPFSTSSDVIDGQVRITVRNLGKGTAQLIAVKPGTRVMMEGPYGLFHAGSARSRRLVVIGIGVGMGPARAILDRADEYEQITLLQRCSTPEDLMFVDEINAISARHPGVTHIPLVGHRGTSWLPASHDDTSLLELVPWIASGDVFVCGPTAPTDAIIREARDCGVPHHHIHSERFTW